MTTKEITKFREYLRCEANRVEHKIINPDDLSTLEFRALLIRYTFYHRLSNDLHDYTLEPTEFLNYVKQRKGIERLKQETEVIYNKYFSSRTKRAFKDVIESIKVKWWRAIE